MAKIPIKCTGSRALSYKELKNFQGNLKIMPESKKIKLKKSIIEKGWIAPIFVWNKKEILDGHGRLKVLAELLNEGYEIDDLPVVDIQAKTKKEAAGILLAINSKYQDITDEGLLEFIEEVDLDLSEIAANCILPDINFEEILRDLTEQLEVDENVIEKSAEAAEDKDENTKSSNSTPIAPIIIRLTVSENKQWRLLKKKHGFINDTEAFRKMIFSQDAAVNKQPHERR